jgi:hypothetical protein
MMSRGGGSTEGRPDSSSPVIGGIGLLKQVPADAVFGAWGRPT